MSNLPLNETDAEKSANAPSPQHGGEGLLSLRIRSLISDKEMIVAMANRDAQFGDGWLCDYATWHGEIEEKLQRLFAEAGQDQHT